MRARGGVSRARARAKRIDDDGCAPRACDADDERAETIEYAKTLGGFSFGSLGLFVALTEGAGMEDVLAGNLVLVALCAYGAYLLFFDGGVTQQALENQAIRQLSEEEGEIGVEDAALAEDKAKDAVVQDREREAKKLEDLKAGKRIGEAGQEN